MALTRDAAARWRARSELRPAGVCQEMGRGRCWRGSAGSSEGGGGGKGVGCRRLSVRPAGAKGAPRLVRRHGGKGGAPGPGNGRGPKRSRSRKPQKRKALPNLRMLRSAPGDWAPLSQHSSPFSDLCRPAATAPRRTPPRRRRPQHDAGRGRRAPLSPRRHPRVRRRRHPSPPPLGGPHSLTRCPRHRALRRERATAC